MVYSLLVDYRVQPSSRLGLPASRPLKSAVLFCSFAHMQWARNQRMGIFLSFWMLWSTVGIKLYLEYCACHEAIQTSLFAPDDSACLSGTIVSLDAHVSEDGHPEHGCCQTTTPVEPTAHSCCSASADLPVCPPEGCDSQDVQEYRVTTPFLLSGQDWPVFQAPMLVSRPHLSLQEIRVESSTLLKRSQQDYFLPAGRQNRILFQSFQC